MDVLEVVAWITVEALFVAICGFLGLMGFTVRMQVRRARPELLKLFLFQKHERLTRTWRIFEAGTVAGVLALVPSFLSLPPLFVEIPPVWTLTWALVWAVFVSYGLLSLARILMAPALGDALGRARRESVQAPGPR